MTAEIWYRPWARYRPERRQSLAAGPMAVPADHAAPVFLYSRGAGQPQVDGRSDTLERHARMSERDGGGTIRRDIETGLWLMPFPVRHRPATAIAAGGGLCHLDWPQAPERPPSGIEPENEDQRRAAMLMLRAEAV